MVTRFLRQRKIRALIAISVTSFVVLCGLYFEGTYRKQSTRTHRSVIVVGVDGMDPKFVEAHWSRLPHLDLLRRRGSFAHLGTTDPPQSPVAWATFATGLSPDQHGIYDFVERDPATLAPFSSFGRTAAPALSLPFGPFRFPLNPARLITLRHGVTFWELLANYGIPVTVIKMPDNYPPLRAGHELAGMGTPDLNGSLGTFSFYTDDPAEPTRTVDGGRIDKVALQNGHARLTLIGPPNTLRRDERNATANIIVDIDPERPVARFALGGQEIILKQGEWSGWLEADFPLFPFLETVRGMVRIFVKQLHPYLKLYVSPVNVDPFDPTLPISSPASWSKTIAQEMGPYSTLGIPEDTSALRENVLDIDEFGQQSRFVLDEEQRLLRYSLRHFKDGLLFYYFSSVDQNSHVLWGKNEQALLQIYRKVDQSIGDILETRPKAELIVMSDHGFTFFNRAVHLNTWLYENGFLALKQPPGESTSLSDVDWSKTKAYALGLNALYLNLACREKNGIAHRGDEANRIASEIRNRLLALRDPVNAQAAITSVAFTHPAAVNARTAPDMIVGYAPGYRASWQTALGGIPNAIISDNEDEWRGDHCIDPASVPGVFFSSFRSRLTDPKLQDLTATILHLFAVKPPAAMQGKSAY